MAGVLSTTKSIFGSTQQSGRVGSALSTFTRFKICFTSTPLTCGNGQVNVIKLIQFNTHRNWNTVNKYNDKVILRFKKSGVEGSTTINLTNQDYGSIGDLADEFSKKLKAALDAELTGGDSFTITLLNPQAGKKTGDTGRRSFSCTMTSTNAHNLTDIRVQFPQYRTTTDETDFNDSYIILGGRRITDSTDTTTYSIKATVGVRSIDFQAPFPMQLHSQPYMYLSLNVANDNLQTANLGNITAAIDEHVTNSCFLAKVPIQTNYCTLQMDESSPYYISTTQKTVTELLFQCLDSHGRQFPHIDDTNEGLDIETQGNLFSDMILRHEVMDIGSDGNLLKAPFKTYNYQVNTLGEAQMIGGGGF